MRTSRFSSSNGEGELRRWAAASWRAERGMTCHWHIPAGRWTARSSNRSIRLQSPGAPGVTGHVQDARADERLGRESPLVDGRGLAEPAIRQARIEADDAAVGLVGAEHLR